MSRLANSQFSFADWELLRQGVVLEPSLAAIADFLDEHEEIIEAIRGDLRCGLKRPDTGRKGLTAQQVLRSLILMRVKNWDYRELRERIADGLTLRQFADFNAQPVPKHDAFQRAFTRITPQTLKLINELLVQAAVAMGLEDGSKLRVDTTVVATDIHHPTDNTLLWDVVRVVTRLVGRLADTIERPIKGFRNRTRAASAPSRPSPHDGVMFIMSARNRLFWSQVAMPKYQRLAVVPSLGRETQGPTTMRGSPASPRLPVAAYKAKLRLRIGLCFPVRLFHLIASGGSGFEVFGQMLEGFEDLAGVLDRVGGFVFPFGKRQPVVRFQADHLLEVDQSPSAWDRAWDRRA
jgi:hypothetical protein